MLTTRTEPFLRMLNRGMARRLGTPLTCYTVCGLADEIGISPSDCLDLLGKVVDVFWSGDSGRQLTLGEARELAGSELRPNIEVELTAAMVAEVRGG